jgi:hypothetical protein
MDRKLAKQVRKILLDKGAEKVRFRNGECHAYGIMRNTNIEGWYFVAFVNHLEKDIGILDR